MNIKTKAHTESFSAKYTVHMPVWYKSGEDIYAVIELEKKLKTERELGLYGFRDYRAE
ncbi:MAG: hypothetical protein RBQ88_07785 [Desulfobulbus oligotrophicus]|jgi:allophanate hydrolase subunit 1|nr:hypothetical protein [Desulfobulbus oligotrophicus]